MQPASGAGEAARGFVQGDAAGLIAMDDRVEAPQSNPSWFDESASLAGAFGGIASSALPTTIVLDGKHRIAAHLAGAVDRARLSTASEHALAPR